MAKRKPARFSAAKAVKANARERVGQPKPSRVLPDAPRTGRQAKHKPKLAGSAPRRRLARRAAFLQNQKPCPRAELLIAVS